MELDPTGIPETQGPKREARPGWPGSRGQRSGGCSKHSSHPTNSWNKSFGPPSTSSRKPWDFRAGGTQEEGDQHKSTLKQLWSQPSLHGWRDFPAWVWRSSWSKPTPHQARATAALGTQGNGCPGGTGRTQDPKEVCEVEAQGHWLPASAVAASPPRRVLHEGQKEDLAQQPGGLQLIQRSPGMHVSADKPLFHCPSFREGPAPPLC